MDMYCVPPALNSGFTSADVWNDWVGTWTQKSVDTLQILPMMLKVIEYFQIEPVTFNVIEYYPNNQSSCIFPGKFTTFKETEFVQ